MHRLDDRPSKPPARSSDRRLRLVAVGFGLLLAQGLLGLAHADPAPRLALVVGNAAYPARPLRTPLNDAALVAETLAVDGFQVSAVADADRATLVRAFADLAAKAKQAGPSATIVVYLAGYGLQRDGQNYIVPVDAAVARDADVPIAALPLSDLTGPLEATPSAARIVVLDLARDNPFVKQGDMPLASGLAPMVAPKGWLYALNTQPGAVAPRQTSPYGAFARALSEMLASDQPIATIIQRVRLRVGESTNGAAIPWSDDGLDPAFTLSRATAKPPETPAVAPADPSPDAYSLAVARDTFEGYLDLLRPGPQESWAARARMIVAVRRETLFFEAALRANDPYTAWTYMRRYPRGPHFFDVRRRLMALQAPLEPPPRFAIASLPDLAPPSPDEVALLDRSPLIFEDADWPSVPAPPSSLLPPQPAALIDGLPPPPLVPAGILPIPILALPPPSASVGHLSEDYAARGPVEVASNYGAAGAASVALIQDGVRLSTATRSVGKDGTTTITQVGADATVIARTTIIETAQGRTMVETGPGGGVLTKTVSWIEPGGGRATLIRNGANQIIADIRRNGAGIVVAATGSSQPTGPRYPSSALRATRPETPKTVTKPAAAPDKAAIPRAPEAIAPKVATPENVARPASPPALPPVAVPPPAVPPSVVPLPIAPPPPSPAVLPEPIPRVATVPLPVPRPLFPRNTAIHGHAVPAGHARKR